MVYKKGCVNSEKEGGGEKEREKERDGIQKGDV